MKITVAKNGLSHPTLYTNSNVTKNTILKTGEKWCGDMNKNGQNRGRIRNADSLS